MSRTISPRSRSSSRACRGVSAAIVPLTSSVAGSIALYRKTAILCGTGFQPVRATPNLLRGSLVFECHWHGLKTRVTRGILAGFHRLGRLQRDALNFRNRGNPGQNLFNSIIAQRARTGVNRSLLDLGRGGTGLDQSANVVVQHQQLESPEAAAIAGIATGGAAGPLPHLGCRGTLDAEPFQF